jgi:hypothetical protein
MVGVGDGAPNVSDRNATSSVTPEDVSTNAEPQPAATSDVASPNGAGLPHWLVVSAWALGPAGLYGLVSLGHAALVERSLSIDGGFGRSLAIWIGAIYLALPLWGFLPARPRGWYARRWAILVAGGVGLIGVVTGAVYAALWLRAHWVPSIGGPVLGSIVVLAVAATFTLWLAGRADRPRGDTPPPAA